ncbi:MAG: hypothetical protein P4L74_07520 [Candidatus Doudnabacteria bacterium]|nr:hypothetical protein [Candidatus Doudnabacteria bacterium]
MDEQPNTFGRSNTGQNPPVSVPLSSQTLPPPPSPTGHKTAKWWFFGLIILIFALLGYALWSQSKNHTAIKTSPTTAANNSAPVFVYKKTGDIRPTDKLLMVPADMPWEQTTIDSKYEMGQVAQNQSEIIRDYISTSTPAQNLAVYQSYFQNQPSWSEVKVVNDPNHTAITELNKVNQSVISFDFSLNPQGQTLVDFTMKFNTVPPQPTGVPAQQPK